MTQTLAGQILAAWVLGLFGAGHCLSMCGGIMGALTMRTGGSSARRLSIMLGYNGGRIFSYCLLGVLAAGVVAALPGTGLPLGRTLAGLLLVAMGLYLAHWWRGLVKLEKLGYVFWARIKPLGDRLLPVSTVPRAFGFGMVWGWLPCGLIYSALAYAAVQSSAWAGGAIMLAFGLGTLPAVLLGGVAANWLGRTLARPGLRRVFALAYILFGLWTIAAAWQHAGHAHHQPASELGEPAMGEPHHHHH